MSGPPRLQLVPRRLAGTYEVRLKVFRDDRGSLARVYDGDVFAAAGLKHDWIQHVIQETKQRNIVRGLHLQLAPSTEAKLLIPISGNIFWAFVDVRRGSPTFGKWDAVEVDAGAGRGLFVPRGFAHGGLSLTDDVRLSIMADNRYVPADGIGVRWDDPEIGIAWPALGSQPAISAEHAGYAPFRDFVAKVGGL